MVEPERKPNTRLSARTNRTHRVARGATSVKEGGLAFLRASEASHRAYTGAGSSDLPLGTSTQRSGRGSVLKGAPCSKRAIVTTGRCLGSTARHTSRSVSMDSSDSSSLRELTARQLAPPNVRVCSPRRGRERDTRGAGPRALRREIRRGGVDRRQARAVARANIRSWALGETSVVVDCAPYPNVGGWPWRSHFGDDVATLLHVARACQSEVIGNLKA